MKIHLYWLDKRWRGRGGCARNYNLLVDLEHKTYMIYIDPFYGYHHPEDIEVTKKSDITEYASYLCEHGFQELKPLR